MYSLLDYNTITTVTYFKSNAIILCMVILSSTFLALLSNWLQLHPYMYKLGYSKSYQEEFL